MNGGGGGGGGGGGEGVIDGYTTVFQIEGLHFQNTTFVLLQTVIHLYQKQLGLSVY